MAPGAGEDRHVGIVVGIEGSERVGQGLGRGAVYGVADLCPVDGDDRHPASLLDQHSHAATLEWGFITERSP
jgi:hypothetical protein